MTVLKQISLIVVVISLYCGSPVWTNTDFIKDKKLQGEIFKYTRNIGWNMCVDDCRRHSDCQSVNYNYLTHRCALNSLSTESCATCKLTFTNGYFYKSVTSLESISTCLQVQCPPYHKCITLNSGVTECIRTECSKEDVEKPLVIESNIREIGQRVVYNCSYPMSVRPNTLNPICTAEGEWHYGPDLCGCSPGFYKCYNSCCTCPVGHYMNGWDADACTPCPLGNYQNTEGQTTCQSCPQWQYQNKVGQSFCHVCNPGNNPWRHRVNNHQCQACYQRINQDNIHGSMQLQSMTNITSITNCALKCDGVGTCQAFTYSIQEESCVLHPTHEYKSVAQPDDLKFFKKHC